MKKVELKSSGLKNKYKFYLGGKTDGLVYSKSSKTGIFRSPNCHHFIVDALYPFPCSVLPENTVINSFLKTEYISGMISEITLHKIKNELIIKYGLYGNELLIKNIRWWSLNEFSNSLFYILKKEGYKTNKSSEAYVYNGHSTLGSVSFCFNTKGIIKDKVKEGLNIIKNSMIKAHLELISKEKELKKNAPLFNTVNALDDYGIAAILENRFVWA